MIRLKWFQLTPWGLCVKHTGYDGETVGGGIESIFLKKSTHGSLSEGSLVFKDFFSIIVYDFVTKSCFPSSSVFAELLHYLIGLLLKLK